MADQIKALETNIENLRENIFELNKDETAMKMPTIKWLSTRQIAKKILIRVTPDPVTENDIHKIVYGKAPIYKDGKLMDNEDTFPECVNTDRAMDLKHPIIKIQIPDLLKGVKQAINTLCVKLAELKKAYIQAGLDIKSAYKVITITAPAMLPTGTGLPIGIAAGQSVVVAVTTLASRTMEILPILGPLINIPLLVAAEVLETILGFVNLLLDGLNIILGSINLLKDVIMPLYLLLKGTGNVA